MTDTVNVPREAWGEYKRSQIAHLRPYIVGETLSERVSISMADLEAGSPKDGDMIARNPANHDDQWLVAADYFAANFEPALLAAAPKAEPVSDPYKLEGLGVYVNSSASKALRAQPEAQKGEPVAWRYRNVERPHSGWLKPEYNRRSVHGRIGFEEQPLYTHPAPASDELMEALRGLIERSEEVRDMLAAHPAMQGREHVSTGVTFNNAIARAQRAYVAKHKGPQS